MWCPRGPCLVANRVRLVAEYNVLRHTDMRDRQSRLFTPSLSLYFLWPSTRPRASCIQDSPRSKPCFAVSPDDNPQLSSTACALMRYPKRRGTLLEHVLPYEPPSWTVSLILFIILYTSHPLIPDGVDAASRGGTQHLSCRDLLAIPNPHSYCSAPPLHPAFDRSLPCLHVIQDCPTAGNE